MKLAIRKIIQGDKIGTKFLSEKLTFNPNYRN